MAEKIFRVDDIDGSTIAEGNGGTVTFAFNGTKYSIDLTKENEQKLADALKPFIDRARRVGTSGGSSSSSSRSSKRRDLSKVRDWATANGFKVSERGRVPARVLEAYDAAH